jgi:hypothetical protein
MSCWCDRMDHKTMKTIKVRNGGGTGWTISAVGPGTMSRARMRETARQMAAGARRIADFVRDDLGMAEAGKINDSMTCLTESIASLCVAVERLCDASEKQDGELDELREQLGGV